MTNIELEKATVINDTYRDAAFNRRYYSCLLARTQRVNLVMDIVVAIGTSGAVAAWNIWQHGQATLVWKTLAAIATLVAIAKPFLNLSKKIERYSELVTGWAATFYDIRHLTVRIRTSNVIDQNTWAEFETAQQRVKELGIKDDPSVNRQLQRQCFDEIKQRLPSESLWWPEDISNGNARQGS